MMEAQWRVALLVLLVTPAFVGCIDGAGGAPAPIQQQSVAKEGATLQVSDAPDDGRVQGREFVRGAARSACVANSAASGPCFMGTATAFDSVSGDSGDPAPKALEILGFRVTESVEELEVQLELAGVDPSFEGAMSDSSWTDYNVCWGDWFECVYAQTTLTDDGPRLDWATYSDYTEDCNVWRTCFHAVPIDVEFGEPATITWHVDRDLLPNNDAGADLGEVAAWVGHDDQYTGSRIYAGYTVYDPQDPRMYATYGTVRPHSYSVADEVVGGPLVLELDAPSNLALDPWSVFFDETGERGRFGGPASSPGSDLQAVEIIETPDTLAFEITMGEVRSEPEASTWLMMGLASGEVYYAGFEDVDGSLQVRSVEANGPGPDEWEEVPVEFEIEPGTPGTIRFTYDTNDLAPIAAGDRTTLLFVYNSAEGEYDQEVDNEAAWASLATEEVVIYDDVPVAPYVFQYDHEPSDDGPQTVVRDATGDAASSGALGSLNTQPFDIVYAQVEAVNNEVSKLTLGLADFGDDEVPAGYDATVRALGIDTPAGPIMAFYAVQRDQQPAFYCAPDTLVFADDPTDPMSVPSRQIEGFMTRQTSSAPRQAEPKITFLLPHSCAGIADAGPLEVNAIGGATALVQRNPVSPSIDMVDHVQAEEQISLASTPTPADPDPWWSNTNLWLFGLLALFIVAEGVFLLGRRRRITDARAEDREVAYARMLEDGVQGGAGSDELRERLKPMRAALSISEKQHAHMEAEIRARLAAARGGGRGLVPGETFLDRYEVLRFLAAGGGGRTFLCRDIRLEREVVLKVLHAPEGADLDPVLREARAFSALRHDRILTLYDVEQLGDDVYLILEHVERGSLHDRLEAGPLGAAEMERLGDDILSGLAAVHAAGIVHRDVKPANVLVTSEGRFKLADFGIAHMPDYDQTISVLGQNEAVGTVRYMSPEQARGEPVDARSDLYSAALTLYEAWAGVPYIRPERNETAVEVQVRAANGSGRVDEHVGSKRLRAFFERALAVDPADRFASADRMRVALLDALHSAEQPLDPRVRTVEDGR